MASKLNRLIRVQLKERSLKLKEQHVANIKIKMIDLEKKTIELEMLKNKCKFLSFNFTYIHNWPLQPISQDY